MGERVKPLNDRSSVNFFVIIHPEEVKNCSASQIKALYLLVVQESFSCILQTI